MKNMEGMSFYFVTLSMRQTMCIVVHPTNRPWEEKMLSDFDVKEMTDKGGRANEV